MDCTVIILNIKSTYFKDRQIFISSTIYHRFFSKSWHFKKNTYNTGHACNISYQHLEGGLEAINLVVVVDKVTFFHYCLLKSHILVTFLGDKVTFSIIRQLFSTKKIVHISIWNVYVEASC